MQLAVCLLIHSLDPGKTDETIQFSMAHFLTSDFSNLYHALAEHETDMVFMAQGTHKIYVTDCPSHSYWFEHFKVYEGVHKWMGEEVRLDYALLVKVMHQIFGNLDAKWVESYVAA
jgi:hypothetical protein